MAELFDFRMREDDKTIDRLRDFEKDYGLIPSLPEKYDKKYLDFAYEVLDDKSIIGNYQFSMEGFDEAYIRNSSKIWKQLGLKLEDVQYFKKGFEDLYYGTGQVDEDFVRTINIGNPTNITVRYIDDYLQTGVDKLRFTISRGSGDIFRRIDLPRFEKRITSSIYAHEITHVELIDAGGGIGSYKNKEVLPIVIEELFSDKLGVLELSKNNRFATLGQAIIDMSKFPEMDFKTRIDKETYLHSILQAMSIANVYFNGNNKIKREIIRDINDVFTGDMITEDMLDKYDSNFKDIEPKLKVLKR